MKIIKIIKNILIIFFSIYALLCGFLYYYQEELIFFPKKLSTNFKFAFAQKFEEMNIKTADHQLLNGLLYRSENFKGLIFYLHGNSGCLDSWGNVAKTYTDLNYDVFMINYRGYGKSSGKITCENQLFNDNQLAYNELKKSYSENKIIILGYSIGTGLAAKLASSNNAKLLILQAPYYNLTDLMQKKYPFIPRFILKYKLQTNEFLNNCKTPVIIFHGTTDEVIYYGSSTKLKSKFKKGDRLITLKNQGHNSMSENQEYKIVLGKILK